MNNKVEAVIEIPLNSRNKFEIDEKTKKIKLDRVLYSAMSYPAEYGFIDNTLSDDGDPLDILVITNSPTFPGCIVPARILGYLKVIDNGYDEYYGARPLKRLVNNKLETLIAKKLINNEIKPNTIVNVDYINNELKVS